MSQTGIRIAIDRGGTFTDAWAQIPGHPTDIIFKVLSVSPGEYDDAPTECIRQILEIASGSAIPRGTLLDLEPVESIRMGTTVATNALLERKGERVALLITKGFRDLLKIGNQARPNIFDLSVQRLTQLYEDVVEIDERVTIEGFSEDPEPKTIDVNSDPELQVGLTGEVVRVLRSPDLEEVRKDLLSLWDRGYRSVAIALMHSYTFLEHETAVAKIARELGFRVTVSSELQAMAKIVPRSQSAVADAYLSPMTEKYLDGFRKGFKGELEDENAKKVFVNQSDGGLTSVANFSGLRGVLSGPAGGVIGMSRTCYDAEDGTPLLAFDMGGTSTDVARFAGTLEHIFESTIAQVTIQTPQLDINTVAAGGGSMLFWENGLFKVGPHSAGAHPGPACYGRGGPLTVTDANLFLGRVIPEYFPMPLDLSIVKEKFAALTAVINAEKDGSLQLTPEEVAVGFLSIANATMTRPIRTLSEGRGFETAAHNLCCFGGAGGQHAVAIARDLGIRRALIPRYSSILSAYGMALADVVVENQEPEATSFNVDVIPRLRERFARLENAGVAGLISQGFSESQIRHELYLNMRYQGSDTALMIAMPESNNFEDFGNAFAARHQQEFGFTQPREILIDDVRVRSIGKGMDVTLSSPCAELKKLANSPPSTPIQPDRNTKVYFEQCGWVEVGLYSLKGLLPGTRISGPAMVIDKTQTIIIDPASEAIILPEHVAIEISGTEKPEISTDAVDPVQLSVFGHRFMSVAEQMGQTMQKTSISVNIKERLDYSCAVFSGDGSLVANAPHIPGHLGSMSYAIAYQARRYAPGELKPGDVLLSNHPSAGGTHLPDLTVTTPVFDDDNNPTKILFFVANRGHHADIGGIQPGSMPPHSTELWQEGAAVESFKLVKEGEFDEPGLLEILVDIPASYPGSSGTRTLRDNIADLKAAIASNNKGIHLIKALIKEYTWPVVQYYMQAIQDNASQATRDLLKIIAQKFQGQPLEAIDYIDDGTPLALKITIEESGDAIFDFTGTGPEHFGNLNCPPAIMFSGIMYCLRSMISSDIPLNQGCLKPIKLICPPNTLLSPSLKAATVGSNVETSQRIVDLIFKAFRAAAASQGTCNNLTFGYGGTDPVTGVVTKGFGYYETIAGGSGAGADWDGESGVHTHITNTRISDPETFERRYPVILHEFSIRKGSGGAGRHSGGDGCIRDIEFRLPMQVSILSERRVIAPYGMAGGEEGKRGVNIWLRKYPDGSSRSISLGGKATTQMSAGDHIIVYTPGGGGYGKDPNRKEEEVLPDIFKIKDKFVPGSSVLRTQGSVSERSSTATGN
ncbi:oxoprolinase [Talaromyces pinophilus]|uniref:Oxoprolinase n=1 Tax=Talaromyces pinophilus TaxID=128442 RepID=A0A6N4SKZ5_TALPI|nr:oxoprolinase [Talaromyces pinophilus]